MLIYVCIHSVTPHFSEGRVAKEYDSFGDCCLYGYFGGAAATTAAQ